ncbi:MAG: hypothetical protein WD533_06425 [Dehalococcoidia bacterium]
MNRADRAAFQALTKRVEVLERRQSRAVSRKPAATETPPEPSQEKADATPAPALIAQQEGTDAPSHVAPNDA